MAWGSSGSVIRVDSEQVVRFRAAALQLHGRLPAGELVPALRPCGQQDTPPGNAMLGAAARVEGLSVDMWTKAFERDKTLVELWAMRGSPVVIPKEDLPYFTVGLCPIDDAGVLHGIAGGMDLVIATAG